MASRASSTSEGELVESQPKANTISQPGEHAINGSHRVFGLDGASNDHAYKHRAPSRSPSPYRRKRTRSPSPYRSHRPAARSPSPYRRGRADRSHDDDLHKRKASPPRASRPEKRHNTDRSRHGDRGGRPYVTDGRPESAKDSKETTARPYVKPISYAEIEHPNPVPGFRDGLSAHNRPQKSFNNDSRRDRTGHTSHRENHTNRSVPTKQLVQPAESRDVEMKQVEDEPEVTLVALEDEVPTQESREEKRRRWAAKRAAAERNNLLHQAVLTNASEVTMPNAASPMALAETSISPFPSPRYGDLDSVPASPDVMVIDKQGGFSQDNSSPGNSPSAADYDPMQDMLDDRNRAAKKLQGSEMPSDAYSETDPNLLSTLPAEKVVPAKKQKRELDMFASDDEDEDEETGEAQSHTKGVVLDEKQLDNWDDPEGYYKLINNELVNDGRYRMTKNLGRGVFANVAQAEDQAAENGNQDHRLVAVKMIRRNDLMRKASQKEMDFLRIVNDADPQDKRHIIRLLDSFDHKGHLCIVFEHMSKNLRDLLKEETNGHGLTLPAVKTYARQMFLGLHHLQNCQVIHLDLKPDNVLVSADKKTIKLADFGTAVDKRDVIERTEYLVSRFYRAPEIILGMDIGHPVDMWAIGCTVYELWTGKILFTGRSNNQMVKAFIDCLGWPSEKLLKKGLLNNVLEHFEAGPPLKFISREVDQYNKLSVRKIEQQKKIQRDLKARVHDAARGIAQGGPTVAELNDFADLLNACLHMNVEKRIQPKEALAHKFLVSKNFVSKSAVAKPPMMKRGVPSIRR